MVTEIEAYRRLLYLLNESGIEYMIVGSFAATQHGHIRTTHDIDLVILLTPEQVGTLVAALDDEFYLDPESARTAVARKDMFNAIHFDSGVKVDFWIPKDDDFARTQFSRRQCIDFGGVPAWVESPEDTILSKLKWYRLTPSERQLMDVQGILHLHRDSLDWRYMCSWAQREGIDDLLEQVNEGL